MSEHDKIRKIVKTTLIFGLNIENGFELTEKAIMLDMIHHYQK